MKSERGVMDNVDGFWSLFFDDSNAFEKYRVEPPAEMYNYAALPQR